MEVGDSKRLLLLNRASPLNPELGINQVNNGDNNAPDRLLSVNPNFTGNPEYPKAPLAGGQPLLGIQNGSTPLLLYHAPSKEPMVQRSSRRLLRGPGLTNADLSVLKDIPINGERFKVQFRAEAFNVLNHTNFGTPNFSTVKQHCGERGPGRRFSAAGAAGVNCFGAPIEGTGGVITSTNTTLRQPQMALKLIW